MGKLVKVPDEVYQKAKDIVKENKMPMWKAVGEVYLELTKREKSKPEVNQSDKHECQRILHKILEILEDIQFKLQIIYEKVM